MKPENLKFAQEILNRIRNSVNGTVPKRVIISEFNTNINRLNPILKLLEDHGLVEDVGTENVRLTAKGFEIESLEKYLQDKSKTSMTTFEKRYLFAVIFIPIISALFGYYFGDMKVNKELLKNNEILIRENDSLKFELNNRRVLPNRQSK